MIANTIPFRVWEKTIRSTLAFFLIFILFSLFSIFIIYFFEPNFSSLEKKSSSKHSIRNKDDTSQINQKKGSNFFDETASCYVPFPDIEKNLKFIDYNYRPGKEIFIENKILLSIDQITLAAKENEVIYLNCSDLSKIKHSVNKTPFSITPILVDKNQLELDFSTIYLNTENEIIYKYSKRIALTKDLKEAPLLSLDATKALKSLTSATSYKEDALISLMGGKLYEDKKGNFRIHFDSKSLIPPLSIKKNDEFIFENNCWIKNPLRTNDKPLLIIKSITSSEVEVNFWNESGFFEKNLKISFAPQKKSLLQNFTFDKIYKRNNESVIAQINGKTLILKKGDWLSKKDNSWNHIVRLDDLNDIIEFKSLKELLIFEEIKENKEKEFFIGYLFDPFRQDFLKLEIPLTQKESLVYNK